MNDIIDFHAHLGKVIYGQDILTVDRLIAFMDAHNISRSVILPLVAPEEEDYYYTTEQALADCKKHPDRLIPFANMDPRRGSNDGQYDFYPVLKEYKDLGCKGFGEILANVKTDDPRMKGIYAACGKLGFPVVFDFRMNTTGVYEPIGLPTLESCLREFPNTCFVGHGPAFWAEMSADVIREHKNHTNYPPRPVHEPGRVDALLEQYPNMYADLSAYSAHSALKRDLDYTRRFLIKHHKKLMFGTDRFVNGYMEDPVTIALIKNLHLPSKVERAIFKDTASELLSL